MHRTSGTALARLSMHLHSLVDLLTLEAELECKFASLKRLRTHCSGCIGVAVNGIGGLLMCDRFNFHAALGRGDHRVRCCWRDQSSPQGRTLLRCRHASASNRRLTSRPSGPVWGETILWESMNLAASRASSRRLDELDEAGLAAPAGMDLGLDDDHRQRRLSRQSRVCNGDRLIHRSGP